MDRQLAQAQAFPIVAPVLGVDRWDDAESAVLRPGERDGRQ